MIPIDDQVDAWKRLAELELAKLDATRLRVVEEHSAAFRWLMASLLALNGAGLIAVKDMLHTNSHWLALGCAASFYVGCACALYVAVLGQRASQNGLTYLSKAIAFWTAVHMTGDYNVEGQEIMMGDVTSLEKASKRAPRVGRMSFAFFSLGLLGLLASKVVEPTRIISTGPDESTVKASEIGR